MAWSTRTLAELAGSTPKAVRYYHRLGLLPEPERARNGYRQYGPDHLTRLRDIVRLRDLGVPLADIPAEGQPSREVLRALDRDLESAIGRLRHLRADLATVLRYRATPDTPPEFADISDALSRRDRDLVTLYRRLWDDDAFDDLRVLVSERDDYEDDLDSLAPDADDEAVEALSARMAVALARDQERFPWLRDPAGASPHSRRVVDAAAATAFAELYNAAQLRVFARAVAIVRDPDHAAGPTTAPERADRAP